MAKELYNKEIIPGLSMKATLDGGKAKAEINMDLMMLVDDAAKAIPGESAMEQLGVMLAKQLILALT